MTTKQITALLVMLWMAAVFVVYYWLKTAEIISFYAR